MTKTSKFSPEVRERAVRMVREHRGEYPCVFRRKPASDSEPSRPPIPTDVGHPLRGSM